MAPAGWPGTIAAGGAVGGRYSVRGWRGGVAALHRPRLVRRPVPFSRPGGLTLLGVDQVALISLGWPASDWISMRRGLAFSATGIRSVSTPAS